jgi:AcrR family transcriptional regulator
MTQRSERGGETRQRLLAAAAELLSEGGYAAASVQAIADRVGVSAGALYRHFPSKAHLFVEVFRGSAKRDLAALEKTQMGGSGLARLEVAVALHARRMLANRPLAWALVHEPVDALVDAERLRYRRTYTRHVARLLRDAIAEGDVPEQEVELTAAAIVGAMSEALIGPLSPVAGGGPPEDAIVEHVVRFCRQAVGAGERRRTPKAPKRGGAKS